MRKLSISFVVPCLVLVHGVLAGDACEEDGGYRAVGVHGLSDLAARAEYAAASGSPCVTLPLAITDHLVATNADFANSVYAADLDGDQDIDLLAGSGFDDTVAWFENAGGAPGSAPSFTRHVITESADFVRGVFAADVNGDGRLDVLSASGFDDTIAWYENDGATPPNFIPHIVTDGADFARSVYAADLDGDMDIDVLSASNNDDTVAWYENNGANPPGFTEHVITTTADGARSVFAADVNGDGALDVLSASSIDNTIAWYRSNGAATPSFTKVVISAMAIGAESVFAADLDGDTDMDVLSASGLDSTVAWYRNNGGANPSFTRVVITANAQFASSVFAVDFDNDGDMDVLSASSNDNAVAWWANNGAAFPFFPHLISANVQGALAVYAADVNADDVPDAIAAASLGDRVLVFEVGEPPLGTCCKADGSCLDAMCESDCGVIEHGWAWSTGTPCADVTCPGSEAPAAFLTEALSLDRFKETIHDLAAFGTRHWSQPQNLMAVELIKNKLESFGYDNVMLDPYSFGGQTRNNVYATKIGVVEPTKMYILGAHLDSVCSMAACSGTQMDAPGADDDGSGTASVLEMARVFAHVQTDVSVRFALWNNEETGLNGSEAYVANHRDLQGTIEEPTWLGMIQEDMILYDHGPGLIPDADVEYQQAETEAGAAIIMAEFVAGAMQRYGTMPAEVGNNMNFTDSVPFLGETAAISVRENQRVAEIGNGSNPNYHQPTDLFETYTEQDYAFGFNIVNMICGAVGELVNAQSLADGDADDDGDVDLLDYEQFLDCQTGPGGLLGAGCESFDFNLDGDVDLADLRALQLAFTG